MKSVRGVMMRCGHSANAQNSKGEPVCAICIGIDPGATVVADQPNLNGRKAKCLYGDHGLTESKTTLAYFEHRPNEECDIYYCGCKGWD